METMTKTISIEHLGKWVPVHDEKELSEYKKEINTHFAKNNKNNKKNNIPLTKTNNSDGEIHHTNDPNQNKNLDNLINFKGKGYENKKEKSKKNNAFHKISSQNNIGSHEIGRTGKKKNFEKKT